MRAKLLSAGFALAAVVAAPASTEGAQSPARPPVSDFGRPTDYPNADAAAVARHFDRARKIAGDDLYVFFNTLCIQDQLYKARTNGAQYQGIIPAQQVFDELYYVGQMSVGAWVLKTRDGLILFDALDNADEAKEIIVAGLIQLGFDPKDIKYVVITHAHADHYGGAAYLKAQYGSKLVASRTDWGEMAKPNAFSASEMFDAAPNQAPDDIVLADGQSITLGGQTVHFAVTPGHTPGTLSSYFTVHDRGAAHQVGFYGGMGMPRAAEARHDQIASMTRWMQVAKAAGVDAQIGNHPLHFDGPARFEVLKYRHSAKTNPFVIGVAAYQRYIDLQRECVKLQLARSGEAVE